MDKSDLQIQALTDRIKRLEECLREAIDNGDDLMLKLLGQTAKTHHYAITDWDESRDKALALLGEGEKTTV